MPAEFHRALATDRVVITVLIGRVISCVMITVRRPAVFHFLNAIFTAFCPALFSTSSTFGLLQIAFELQNTRQLCNFRGNQILSASTSHIEPNPQILLAQIQPNPQRFWIKVSPTLRRTFARFLLQFFSLFNLECVSQETLD